MDYALQPAAFSDLVGWRDDRQDLALAAFRRCAEHALRGKKPYKPGALGVTVDDLDDAFRDALRLQDADAAAARAFFERHFLPCSIVPEGEPAGFLTGYYEPEVEVSPHADGDHRHPFYRRPGDLERAVPEDWDAPEFRSHAFGRRRQGRLLPYFDRREIESGALAGRGLEIAWARDRIDVFFAHIQGAARLVYPDGSVRRITYDGKSGHAFTAIGRVLVDLAELDPDTVTMQAIRDWLGANSGRQDEILWRNRSFIFFREAPVAEDNAGPIAAAKVPLTAGRSLAVDRTIHTFATPFYLSAARFPPAGDDFNRLMIAQDTGSAIVGPARGDVFVGSGMDAGAIAGAIRHAADFTVLLPPGVVERIGR